MPTEGPGSETGNYAVTRLTVTDFRNHAAGQIDVPEGKCVVLAGPNGAGKTNLLEALSFLAPGRGLRRASLDKIGRVGAPAGSPWAISARIRTPDGEHQVGTGLDLAGAPESLRRIVRVDGQPLPTQAELGKILAFSWLTPQMDRLFIDGASQRRRFFDRLVHGFVPGHAVRLTAYENAMRQRARLLRDGPSDPVWLDQLEAAMAENGVAVAAARREMAMRLSAAESGDFGRISAFPRAEMAISGTLEADLSDKPALAVEDGYRHLLRAARQSDAAMAGTANGPHRSDLTVTNLDKSLPADQCSTGEQKALLIAIILAQARLMAADRGSPPILLLDEVAAHLDSGRREALYGAIGDLQAQAWMTGTERGLFDGMRELARFVAVKDGSLHEESWNR